MARIITITSGKGGVGKTSISLNLSLSLASEGYRVCLFDADLGLANVSILTGIYPKQDLESVISGKCSLDDIVIRDFQGIDIIPGSSGVEKMADLTPAQTDSLIHAFLDFDAYDYFIFDTSAGISSQVLSFCMASHEIILVATCEPTSLTDAYSMLKVLSSYKYDSPVRVIINQVKSGKAAQKAYAQLKQTVRRFLSMRLSPLGIVASDKRVRSAVVSQTPFFMLYPDSTASKCIQNITEKLISDAGKSSDMPLELFWDRCLSFLEKKTASEKEPEPELKSEPDPEPAAEKAGLPASDANAMARIENLLTALVQEVADIRKILESKAEVAGAVDTGLSETGGRTSRIEIRGAGKNEANPNDLREARKPGTGPRSSRDDMPTASLPEPNGISLDFESWLKKQSNA